MTEAAQTVLAYWSQEKEKGGKQKRTTDSKSTQLMGIQGVIKEMCVGGGGGGERRELVSYISG